MPDRLTDEDLREAWATKWARNLLAGREWDDDGERRS